MSHRHNTNDDDSEGEWHLHDIASVFEVKLTHSFRNYRNILSSSTKYELEINRVYIIDSHLIDAFYKL